MSEHFDAIVLGIGSMGAATCYYLSTRGLRVLGIEQFDIPHDQGSHAGQSRIIRKAYFEHSDYVPLLERAYDNWRNLEKETNEQVYFPVGLLYAGKADQVLIHGVTRSAIEYQIKVDSLGRDELKSRFPQFEIPSDYSVLYEPDAGFLTPERAILIYTEQSIRWGATIKSKTRVTHWQKNGNDYHVYTEKEVYTCKKLIITAGAWSGKLLPTLHSKLKVTRQVIMWSVPRDWQLFTPDRFPCWLIHDHTKPGMYYGFPSLPVGKFGPPIGLKIAYHYPGNPVDPDQVNRHVSPEEEQDLRQALYTYIPSGYASTHALKTCLYTNTPDENFVIDFLPGHENNVVIAAGFSGHGFKFVSAIGEILSDLVIEGKTKSPIGFLGIHRLTS